MNELINRADKPALKGFGSLYLRGNIWWIRYSVRGKDFRESSKTERQADAMRLLKQRWQEVGKGRFIGPSEQRVLVDHLFESLMDNYIINRRRSIGSLTWRLRHLRSFFGGMKAIDISEQDIERYKVTRLAEKTEHGKRPVKPATVNRELAALRKSFRLAVKQKRISAAPSIEMLVEDNARQGFIEPREFEDVVDNLPAYLQDFARFAYVTGWRKGELQSLTWADVNRDAGTILLRSQFSKNGEPRLLPLVSGLVEIIERCWQARVLANPDGSSGLSEYVFHCGNGRPVGDFRIAWATACRNADAPGLLFHDLRRSAVRNFDLNGVTQPVGMLISGHKTLSIYQRCRITPEKDIREALERTQAGNAASRDRRVVSIAKVGDSKK